MKINPNKLIIDNVIKDIRFTQTEIKILSCFATQITKSKSIGAILGSSPKTIDTHIDNIKRKISTNNKENIYFFIKNSSDFSKLKTIFDQIYIEHKYKEAVKKISYKIKTLSIICNFNVSAELNQTEEIHEISQAVKIAGIHLINIPNLLSLQSTPSNSRANYFYLFVVQSVDEIKYIQKSTNILEQNIIYICLNTLHNEQNLSQNNIFFYNKEDKKTFYQFFLKNLIKSYNILDKENEILEFLSSINNDIQSELEDVNPEHPKNSENFENSEQKNNFFSRLTTRKWMTILIPIILAVVFITFYHHPLPKTQKSIISVGISNLKRNTTSEVFVFNMPPINNNFTGRSKNLIEIKDNFHKNNIGVVIQAIAGSGGIGKTQLVTEYAYRALNDREYDAILWFTADSLNKINDTYAELANRLSINIENLNSVAIMKVIHNELREKYKIKKVLFVLDNIPQEKEIELFLAELRSQWPIDSKPHVLITSRNQHVSSRSLILDVFSQNEAIAFIQKHLPYETEQNITKLATLLSYYPLALQQAVGYIKQHTNIEDYINLYYKKTQQYLNLSTNNFDTHKETLWKTLFISLSKLSNNAKEILYISSYFEPNDIQLNFFNQFTIEQRAKAIKELREHSFITMSKNRQSFKIHVLIQEIIRLMNKENTPWLHKAKELAKNGISSFNSKKKSTWENVRIWLYHITSIYKYIPETLESAKLLDNYGDVAKHFGLYNLAHELLTKSLHIKEQHCKNINDIKLIGTLGNLGLVELELAHYDKAKELYQKILNIQKIYYKRSDHINISKTLNDIGSVEILQGNYNRAKELYQRALKIKENHYQSLNHIELTNNFEGLGIVEFYFGHYDKAKELLHKSLTIKENHYKNPYHIDLANTLHFIGYIEICLGYYEKAKRLQERALKIYNKIYKGTNNILAVDFLQRLAVSEWGLGNFNTAKNLYKEVLQIKQDHYQDPNHIAIAVTLQGLGLAEFSCGNYLEAKKFLEQDLKIRKNHYQSEKHILLASSTHTLGLSEEGLGNYDAALAYITKAYTISSKHYKLQLHKAMASDYSPSIPWPKLTQKNKSKAINYYKQSLEITKNLFGEEYHMVARCYYLLGQAYEENKDKKLAIKNYKKALSIASLFALRIYDDNVLANHHKNINKIKSKLFKLNP